MYADKYVSQLSDIPTEAHWAIVETVSVYTPGDERSRTNPGHGYPESTDYYIKYEVYLTQEKWKKAIENREEKSGYSKRDYRAMQVNPAKISSSVSVNIDT